MRPVNSTIGAFYGARSQHCLDEFFNEERIAVSGCEDLLDQGLGRRRPNESADERRGGCNVQAGNVNRGGLPSLDKGAGFCLSPAILSCSDRREDEDRLRTDYSRCMMEKFECLRIGFMQVIEKKEAP